MASVVPWFSSNEWLEVYENGFSHVREKWKAASNQILVWKARSSVLPVGIEATLPLLTYHIHQNDPNCEECMRQCFQKMAILKFVSIMLNYLDHSTTMTMMSVAVDINFPQHLIYLRNELVHSGSLAYGEQTMNSAIQTAWEWIKGFYWDPEAEVMRKLASSSLEDSAGDEKKITALLGGDLSSLSQKSRSQFLHLERLITSYLMSVTSYEETADAMETTKMKNQLLLKLKKYLKMDDVVSTFAVVQFLLLPKQFPDLLKVVAKNTQGKAKKCICGCSIPKNLVQACQDVLEVLYNSNCIHILLWVMTELGEGNASLALEWLQCLLVKYKDNQKKFTCWHLPLKFKLEKKVILTDVIFKLFEKDWSRCFSQRLMERKQYSFPQSQKDQLILLNKAYRGISVEVEEENNSQFQEEVLSLDMLSATSKGHCSAAADKIKRFRKHEKELGAHGTCVGWKKAGKCAAPLGVLQDQQSNPYFYKQLLLPEEHEKSSCPLLQS